MTASRGLGRARPSDAELAAARVMQRRRGAERASRGSRGYALTRREAPDILARIVAALGDAHSS